MIGFVFLKAVLMTVSSVSFFMSMPEGEVSFWFYLRLGVSSDLFFMGGNLVTVFEFD
jgi:hypothetical protein